MKISKATCDEIQVLLMGLMDGELDEEQKKQVDEHLEECDSCREQYQSFIHLKRGTSEMKLKQLPEMYWDEYWDHVYNKIERGFGWILVSLGALVVFSFGAYQMFKEFFTDPQEPLTMKIGLGLLIVGLIVLFISVVREKIMVRRADIYRRIKR